LNRDGKVSPNEFWVLTYKMLELAALKEQNGENVHEPKQHSKRPHKKQQKGGRLVSHEDEKSNEEKTLQQKLNDPKEIQRLKQNSRI